MNYESLIRQAWNTTWRNRWLWVLGLFAALMSGMSGRGPCERRPLQHPPVPARPVDLETLSPQTQRDLQVMGGWLTQKTGALIAWIVGGLLHARFSDAVVSLIAEGGMAQATGDLARGRKTSLGQAWGGGFSSSGATSPAAPAHRGGAAHRRGNRALVAAGVAIALAGGLGSMPFIALLVLVAACRCW